MDRTNWNGTESLSDLKKYDGFIVLGHTNVQMELVFENAWMAENEPKPGDARVIRIWWAYFVATVLKKSEPKNWQEQTCSKK